MKCRHCGNKLTNILCDLQTCPPSNAMVREEMINFPETYFPLKVFVCEKCWLVQVDEIEKAENIFNEEYTYFSSFSKSWLAHSNDYVEYMMSNFKFNSDSLVVEVASNDGYLLQYFKEKNIPVLGIEPTANTAKVAKEKGIESIIDFFGSELAKKELEGKSDLILGNNVLAHVPDINDFVKGIKIALKSDGINTFEFPHLCKMMEFNQFDTIYHEHFSYLSLTALKSVFEKQGLEFFDVQEIPTHGGSLRVFSKHIEDKTKQINTSVESLLSKENKKVVAYGAAAKGNTLLNFCGIKGTDLISYVMDASPHKQNKYLPGSRIPVFHPAKILETQPDYVMILPWNLKEEISEQLSFIKSWGGKFIVAIPELKIF